eukprot:3704065-Alexandrium_andersonii.AAC.1
MYDTNGFSTTGFPFRLTEVADYEAACARCEHTVVLASEHDHQRVLRSLVWDKRRQGSHGRAVNKDFADLGIKKGDR